MNSRFFIWLIALISFSGLYAQVKHGTASYYAQKFEGRRCASGERFSNNLLTCAHNSLPFGTLIKVCIQDTACVVVKVNDRLSKRSHRTIDLSRKAATLIGLKHAGIMKVSYEVVGRDSIMVAKHVVKAPSSKKKKGKKNSKKKRKHVAKKKPVSKKKKVVNRKKSLVAISKGAVKKK